MKRNNLIILWLLFGMIFIPQTMRAQVDFNKTPDDDLGDNEDAFQELFYEGLKQKSIENYDRAVEAFLKCIEIDKSVPVLYFELGKSYNKLKNFGSAEDAFKKAVDKDPNNEWFLDELYGFYAEQNQHDEALKTVEQLVKYHPDYKEDLVTLLIKTEKYDEALKLLDELDAELGVSVTRDMMRNNVYDLTGRKEEQIENLQSRIKRNPNKESNYLALIFRYSENNQKEKAFETAKQLLNTHPNSQLVHLALYKFYLDDNEPEKAIESMKIVVQSTAIKPEAKLKVLNDFVSFVQQYPQYQSELVEATSMVSEAENGKSLMELGHYHLSNNNKEKALESFEKVLVSEPNNILALKNILLLYIDFETYDLAKSKSSEVLEKFPSQPLFYLINGVACNALGVPNEAIEALDAGIDYIIDDPKMEADFYLQLSKAYTLLNNTVKAKTFSDKAKQIQSSN
ncbi:tetratricopeptide repeat protein [Tamlana fucoidanivorans]|uniref:Tetratricopeptide repeat protein n=1 Tax=Allotamlana fucoidanivorans TaxID=2583814 RepID=A0A5C4STR8_9FLAO|nr:tetratricopeptide repeat protein [Tamlana fucoidanivorans]TNJ47011.1 tetratricopeptide repeat protein [Tamlana fucoidanivorans]